MALKSIADEYFRTLNPLAEKIYEDIEDAKSTYENLWDSLTEKERIEVINESIIKPEICLQYALIDSLDFDLDNPPLRKDDLMDFFGREHGLRIVQDDNGSWKDEHSAPFIYQTKSQLNLCALKALRAKIQDKLENPPPVVSELVLSHSKVVDELKSALKTHDKLKSTNYNDSDSEKHIEIGSPSSFLTKFISNKFGKARDEDKQCLVASEPQSIIIAPTEVYFKGLKSVASPPAEIKNNKDYNTRSSIAKSCSEMSEEKQGLLSMGSRDSSGGFQSCEELGPLGAADQQAGSTDTLAPLTGTTLPRTGLDFLDNW